MKQFRITATCFGASGAPIPVTWYGEAETPNIAVQCMREEAHGNGWSMGAVTAVQQREYREVKA
ncbi:hypothetical protein [Enterobacter roggenkampii]|uniref:hypothetical protein n=1 Tax=Enterobacter roggenkampii TaxID=1812935 RepID=UPI002FFC1D72